MAASKSSALGDLPDEMFNIIKAAGSVLVPRLGRLALPGRKVTETPHFLAGTSRGAVPHITQDTFARDTSIGGVYVALEDFIERAPSYVPPIFMFHPPDGSSPLRRFVALPDETLLVLGARRTPPVAAPSANPNTHDAIAVCTAVGFKTLTAEDFAGAAQHLQADIVVGMGDVPHGRSLGSKRIEKATDRTIQWMTEQVGRRKADASEGAALAKLFAPLLPITCANQQFYIDCLTDELAHDFSGLAIYDLSSVEDLPEALHHLPRLDLTEPKTPHEVLQRVALGMDILTVPFVTAATDAGIALAFAFEAPTTSPETSDDHPIDALPLGTDMWLPTHAVDLSALVDGCHCYTCINHHRAYLQHLLVAKEMLGWVLLQIHNHHMIDVFFRDVRQSIADGKFDDFAEHFSRAHESSMPATTGQGPRVRGYQFRSEGRGEGKKNKAPFTRLDGANHQAVESALRDTTASVGESDEPGLIEMRV
ncbi:hypothetical protein LTR91_007589 [Friedmanniomyces endolithicus]|uniref:Queuine tRNA-ribosyltransferase accessory subunit 2 n=1 Tax=Friedmanniomyces endolithicus TaxID=329885 RepID=A0AAN6QUX8_9PEZI|nr:hypothetical protein LTR94_003153 [Friedmanniomyces endolithicus]KAK0813788.1 hypothetical protein LTR59_000943 [Friedmanniomyces endolithicus]KAK0814778.1 hypothetical protein LTR38_002608 [Friedmanniomyces endolithicus]KAK0815054.1 hypothetical protein LTR75_004055 [Friedmanniomyces endolithicus]KAK0851974.1 hypothetical protein LTR03_003719 [Friedmanniomyces endolithicus]